MPELILVVIHDSQHRLAQRFCPRHGRVAGLLTEQSRRQQACGYGLNRPVGDQQAARAGIEERPAEAGNGLAGVAV